MGARANQTFTVASAVANDGTFTIPYPAGMTQAILLGATGGQVATASGDVFPQASSGVPYVTFTYNSGDITVTNKTGQTIAAGTVLTISHDRTDRNGSYNLVVGTTRGTAADGGGGNPNYDAPD